MLKGKCDDLTVEFLSQLFVYNPNKRLKPLQALAHPYFNEIRQQKINVKFDLFDFSKGTENKLQKKITKMKNWLPVSSPIDLYYNCCQFYNN